MEMAMSERKYLGNYRLIKQVGEGGYAQVYLGIHILLQVPVAIKLLHRVSWAEHALFLEEARMIARLDHPSIIRLRDFAVIDGVPFLVMDFAAGGGVRRPCPPAACVPLPLVRPPL